MTIRFSLLLKMQSLKVVLLALFCKTVFASVYLKEIDGSSRNLQEKRTYNNILNALQLILPDIAKHKNNVDLTSFVSKSNVNDDVNVKHSLRQHWLDSCFATSRSICFKVCTKSIGDACDRVSCTPRIKAEFLAACNRNCNYRFHA